jgi:hypothetical protein
VNDAQRTWIEAKDETICRVLQDGDPGDFMFEAMWWLGQVQWDRDRMPALVEALREYGKPEALIDAMRQAYMAWCT